MKLSDIFLDGVGYWGAIELIKVDEFVQKYGLKELGMAVSCLYCTHHGYDFGDPAREGSYYGREECQKHLKLIISSSGCCKDFGIDRKDLLEIYRRYKETKRVGYRD